MWVWAGGADLGGVGETTVRICCREIYFKKEVTTLIIIYYAYKYKQNYKVITYIKLLKFIYLLQNYKNILS